MAMPEEQNLAPSEAQERASSFVKEYGELVKKHNIDFAAFPQYVPDGNGGFRTVVQNVPVDITKKEEFVTKE